MTSTLNTEYVWRSRELPHTYSYMLPQLLSLLPPSAVDNTNKVKVLDLGCGNGSLCSLLSDKGYDVVGLDSSASGIKLARQNFPDCSFNVSSTVSRWLQVEQVGRN